VPQRIKSQSILTVSDSKQQNNQEPGPAWSFKLGAQSTNQAKTEKQLPNKQVGKNTRSRAARK